MNLSFYTAAVGAGAQQTKLDVIANNLANTNNAGYKTKNAGFVDLLYSNIRNQQDLQQGCGARVEKTDIIFTTGALEPTDSLFDFAINGEGFFAVQNPETGNIAYTRSGCFQTSLNANGQFNLVTSSGEYVLSREGNPIVIQDINDPVNIGVFNFQSKEGFLCIGNNLFVPVERNGNPYLVEDADIRRKTLEMSNVDLPREMTGMIQAQRAYQLALRMVQTSDEIETTINNLRG